MAGARGGRAGTAVAAILSASLLALFLLPLAALATSASPSTYVRVLADPAVRLSIGFTLYASGIALGVALLFGVPLGYLLARRNFPGKTVVESLVGLPIVVPHLVAGLALLLLLSPGEPVGRWAASVGFPVVDTLLGVVLVMVYVSAPYTVLASALAFRAVDDRVVEAARCLGATPSEAFATVTLPLAVRGIVAGGVLTWARSVSEIGGFLILADYVYPGPGYSGPVTSAFSLAIYNLWLSGDVGAAAAAASIFVLIAFALFVAVRWLERGGRLPWGRGELIP